MSSRERKIHGKYGSRIKSILSTIHAQSRQTCPSRLKLTSLILRILKALCLDVFIPGVFRVPRKVIVIPYSLLRYCEGGEDRRFGRIEFVVGADVTPEFKKAVLTEVGEKD